MSRGQAPAVQGGQSMVEFALVLPIFLLLLFGLIDIGRYVYTANAVNEAAREGARLGSVAAWSADCSGSRETCVRDITMSRLAGVAISAKDVTVQCWRYNPARPSEPAPVAVALCRANDFLSVRLDATFQVLTPVIGQFLGGAKVTGVAKVMVHQ
jgi:Flp pilus assembly protein TadG